MIIPERPAIPLSSYDTRQAIGNSPAHLTELDSCKIFMEELRCSTGNRTTRAESGIVSNTLNPFKSNKSYKSVISASFD